MQVGALRPYERSLLDGAPLGLRDGRGRTARFEVDRWVAPADAADATVLDRCTGPVLDVGCGPGRLLTALRDRHVDATGVDIAGTAVSIARRAGTSVLLRNVFDPLPREGEWSTLLLLDGNIGIGGDPVRLLTRLRELARPGGRVVVEAHPDRWADEILRARFTTSGRTVGPSFPWAHVGLHALRGHAVAAGLRTSEVWTADARTFVELTCP